MIHNLLGDMLGVQNSQLGKDSNVSIIKAETLLEERDKVIEVSKIGVVTNNLVDVVGVFDHLKTTSRGEAELAGTQTCEANSLPGGYVVRLPCGCNSLAVLLQMDVTKRKFGVVVDAGEKSFSGIVQSLVEAPVSNSLDVGNVGPVHKLFQLGEVVSLGVGVDQLSIQYVLLKGLASHDKVRDDLGPDLSFSGFGANSDILGWVFGIDVTLNGISRALLFKLDLSKFGPNRLLVDLSGVCLGSFEILHEINKDTNCADLHLALVFLALHELRLRKLDIDTVGLLVQHVALGNTDEGNVLGVEVIKLINVSSNTASIGTNSGKDKKVLQVFVVREV
mmetsp:Transcript_18537/g.27070  ORF Transcript_18537/g.27070 Transcript_18537/m.27070 type:complete len:335 (-) Transcript_18537:304-1308(-)